MTPKEKAEELYNDFSNILPDAVENHKGTVIDCALKVVDEILEVVQNLYFMGTVDYWNEVKQEIEKL